jgi:hypothetical protein
MLVAITYFHYLLFCFQFFRVRFENTAKFTEKLFLGGELLVELAEVVTAVLVVVVVILNKMLTFSMYERTLNLQRKLIISIYLGYYWYFQHEKLFVWNLKRTLKVYKFKFENAFWNKWHLLEQQQKIEIEEERAKSNKWYYDGLNAD